MKKGPSAAQQPVPSSTSNAQLSLTGFESRELDDSSRPTIGTTMPTRFPPVVPDQPASNLGDLWVCGKHRVLCGDATSSNSVQIGITSAGRLEEPETVDIETTR
jgi:hypothetical protein